ncbi:hypothetical protein [Streptomyces bicolor]|uniref:hypothetical protein n=1 Tax=Streptomyces bicolor TaxID=66874 RepID=UPI000996B454|nr:hypothetical protein [Streptomyces bicolor]
MKLASSCARAAPRVSQGVVDEQWRVPGGDRGWPAFDSDHRLVRLLDAAPTVAAYPEGASRRIWEGHTFAELPLTTT